MSSAPAIPLVDRDEAPIRPPNIARRRNWLNQAFTRLAGAGIYAAVLILLPLFRLVGTLAGLRRRPRATAPPCRVMVVATFYSRNWSSAHLAPLASCPDVQGVDAIVDGPAGDMPGIEFHRPPRWAKSGVARAVCKAWSAFRVAATTSPDLIMGYHLLPCGMIALLASQLVNARAAYQLTGGPLELIGGGYLTENFFLRRLGRPSHVMERLALRTADRFDLLLPRGSTGRDWLMQRRLGRIVRTISGCVADAAGAESLERPIDVVAVGRLAAIKQPEQWIRVAAAVAARRPELRMVILGDGPARTALETLARDLGVENCIEFSGHVEDVRAVLVASKVFLLTSRSEGLSIAMIEAMAAGAVPVVADVGELAELVDDGRSGFRVAPNDIAAYAERIIRVLDDETLRTRLSQAARNLATGRNARSAVARRWSSILADLFSNEDAATRPKPALRQRLYRRLPRWRGLAGPVARLRSPEAWLGREFRARLAELRALDQRPPEEVAYEQLARLQRIVRHAYERSPFHRERMERAGFHPADFRSLNDLSRLPTMSAADVRTAGDALLTLRPSDPRVEFVHTGGSGGRPLRVPLDCDRSAIEYAHLVASWQRAGYDFGHALAVIRGNEGVDGERLFRRDPFLRRYHYNGFRLDDAALRRLHAHLATIGPFCLLAYPSIACALARFLTRTGLPVPANLRSVLLGSEILYPDQRSMLEKALGVRCFSWYGLTEKVALAAECETCSDMHVWPTYGYVELLDQDGLPISRPGLRGEIVATGLFNRAAPLIRYRTGDEATYVGARCEACGRVQLTLRDIRGHRTQETLLARGGAAIPWTAVNAHDETFAGVQQFQFVQQRAGEAELHVVPSPALDAAAERRLGERVTRRLQGMLEITVRRVDHIALTHRGKSTYVRKAEHLEPLERPEEVVTP